MAPGLGVGVALGFGVGVDAGAGVGVALDVGEVGVSGSPLQDVMVIATPLRSVNTDRTVNSRRSRLHMSSMTTSQASGRMPVADARRPARSVPE